MKKAIDSTMIRTTIDTSHLPPEVIEWWDTRSPLERAACIQALYDGIAEDHPLREVRRKQDRRPRQAKAPTFTPKIETEMRMLMAKSQRGKGLNGDEALRVWKLRELFPAEAERIHAEERRAAVAALAPWFTEKDLDDLAGKA